MVNRSKSKMLCLPIIMSTWLCSYMNTVGEESREKPLKMLQFLKNINPTEGEVHFTERYIKSQSETILKIKSC